MFCCIIEVYLVQNFKFLKISQKQKIKLRQEEVIKIYINYKINIDNSKEKNYNTNIEIFTYKNYIKY